jgi:hypothetical protein
VAVINKRYREGEKQVLEKHNDITATLATNGSGLPIGELAEAILKEVHDTKNAVRRVERKVDQHHRTPASVAHPREED